jgi:HAE1 family hydrophobic/amphiphilic exporter-1
MSRFFINRPIVAMVISILMTIIGIVAMSGLPIAQFPNIVPPQIQVNSTYTGADALTLEQAVATPIEQQMSGVDNMDYMYSINANNGQSTLYVNFALGTDANTDQLLAQMREGQAESQLPSDVRNYGVTVQKSTSSPLVMFALYSPKGTYDNIFLANYSYININDQMTRIKGIASVTVFGAGQYAMRLWVRPDVLAKLNITIPEIINAVQTQNTVNPAGQVGAQPVPSGQEFTYAVRAQGRLVTEEDFGKVVLRANPDGSIVRVSDVARIELGAQTYSMEGRLNGKPAALIALYQMPGANALDAANGAKALMEKIKKRFPPDLDYVIALDTTLSVTEGHQGNPAHAVRGAGAGDHRGLRLPAGLARDADSPAGRAGLAGRHLHAFPLFGFSINTLSLFGLVLAIGLVVDDAIVVVEAVEHHIEQGLSPKDATLKAMSEVTGPVIAIAVILAAVFVPTAFIPGITGQLYQQFAVTIAISVVISAFNALTLSPALCALLLRPKVKGSGPLQKFYDRFNVVFGRITGGYVGICRIAIRKSFVSILFIVGIAALAGLFGKTLPAGFLPDEDQGYVFAGVQLPDAGSLQRTSEIARQAEDLIKDVPGVKYVTTVVGYSMLSQVQNTYSAFFFVTFDEWSKRKKPEEQYGAIKAELSKRLAGISGAIGFAFPPPAIQGVGVSGGATFILQDRAGKDIAFLAEQTNKFLEAARKRPELTGVTTFRPGRSADVHRRRPGQGAQAGGQHQGCLPGLAEPSWAAASSTISTASAASGRSTSRRKGSSAPTSRMWASSTCATRTASRCRCRR